MLEKAFWETRVAFEKVGIDELVEIAPAAILVPEDRLAREHVPKLNANDARVGSEVILKNTGFSGFAAVNFDIIFHGLVDEELTV